MHFVVTAFDGADSGAGARRSGAREGHLAGAEKMHRDGRLLYAAALLDDEGGMTGSIMIVDFPSKEALEREWLDDEPYVKGNVWKEIDVRPCRAPGFISGV